MMAKTLCPEDFYPDEGKINLLNKWGMVNSPKGDQLCGEWFTTRVDIIAEFIDYWTRRKGKGTKRPDWQATYCNYIKNIAWPNELRDYEKNRHKRSDAGSGGFVATNEAYGQLMSDKPLKPKYRVPTAEDSLAEFKRKEREILG